MPSGGWRLEDWSPLGDRSGLVEVGSPQGHFLNVVASTPPPAPASSSVSVSGSTPAAPEETLARAAVTTPEFTIYPGPRSDLPGGWGPRVRTGLLSDTTYGIERWSSTGVRTVGTFS